MKIMQTGAVCIRELPVLKRDEIKNMKRNLLSLPIFVGEGAPKRNRVKFPTTCWVCCGEMCQEGTPFPLLVDTWPMLFKGWITCRINHWSSK